MRNSNFSGMRRHVTLEDEEFSAIAVAMPLHVLVGDCASFCVGRTSFEEVAGGYSVISRLGAIVAERIRREFHARAQRLQLKGLYSNPRSRCVTMSEIKGGSALGRGGFAPNALTVWRRGRCVMDTSRWRTSSLRPSSL